MAVVLALLALALPAVALAQADPESRLDDAKQRMESLSSEIEAAEQNASEAEAELENAEQRLAEVEQVVNEVAAQVERQRGAVEEAEQRLAEVQEEAERLEQTFADRANRMFKQGASMSFEVLFSADSAGDAFARTSYLRQITEADSAGLEELEAAHTAVEAEQERLVAEEEELEQMLAEQRELQAEAERIRDSRAMAAARAQQEVEELEHEHDELEQDQEELEDLIERRQEQARSGGGSANVSAPSSSGFSWPLCAPVTSEYGMRWGRLHAGIDQGAGTGTPIGASKSGTVIHAGRRGGYGNMVLVDHHDGVVTAYAHMSRIGVSRGQSVSQGQTLGAVGSTGNSTGPHLHFETRVNGSAVNPRQYLPGSPC